MTAVLLGINYHDLFIPGIGIVEKILRPVLVYFVLIIGLRLAGKREMAQLNTFDMVVLLSLSNAVQNAIIGNDNSLSGGIIGAASLLTINFIMNKVLYHHKKLQHLFEGEADIIIKHGIVRQSRLSKELITMEELVEAAQKQGIASLSEVDEAILQPNGGLSFITKEPGPEILRHNELLKKLDKLSGEIDQMKKQMKNA